MDKKELLERCKEHIRDYFIKINPDKKRVEQVLKGLLKNKEKYGEIYCPCRVVSGNKKRDKLNICPCAYHMGEIELKGKCLCGLFVKG